MGGLVYYVKEYYLYPTGKIESSAVINSERTQ